jgi:hypothetical protein
MRPETETPWSLTHSPRNHEKRTRVDLSHVLDDHALELKRTQPMDELKKNHLTFVAWITNASRRRRGRRQGGPA